MVVSNTGNVPLTNVDTQDVWTPGTCDSATIPNLGVGQSFSMVCTATLPPTGNVNTVTATAKDPFGGPVGPATASATITRGTPTLSITKTASTPGPVKVDDTFTYTVTVTNNSTTQTHASLVVSDALPAGLVLNGTVTATKPVLIIAEDGFGTTSTKSYTTGTGWATTTPTGWIEGGNDTTTDAGAGKIQVDTATGDPKNSLKFDPDNKTYEISRSVNLAGATSGSLTFDCSRETWTTKTGDPLDSLEVLVGTTRLALIDPDYPTSGTSNYCPTSNGSPFGTITVPLPTGSLTAGATIKFIANGNRKFFVDNVKVIGTLPPVSVTAGNPPTLTSVGGPYSLAPNGVVTFTIPVKVTAAPADGFQFSNLASATSLLQTTPVSASVITPYKLTSSFNITKTAVETWVNSANSLVTYRFELRNTGNSDLTFVSISDPLCDAGTLSARSGDLNSDGVLQVGEIWRYSCTNTVSSPTGTRTSPTTSRTGWMPPSQTPTATPSPTPRSPTSRCSTRRSR